MKKALVTSIFIIIGLQVFSQEIHRIVLCESDPHRLYLNDGKSDTLFYYQLKPESNNNVVLILLPGFFRNSREVFQRTDLPDIAYDNGIATLVPSINSRIHSDTSCFKIINDMIVDYSYKNDIEVKNIIIGGLSAGGIISLTYTIWMNKNPVDEIPPPKAVFTIDSPVDLHNFWHIEKRIIERDCSRAATEEAIFVINYFERYLGGSPEEIPEVFKKVSPFSREDKYGGNIFHLRNTAIRAYCEPDISYHLNKCEDYFDMNASDLSSMINKLKMLGNSKAEFITTINKGYRLDGSKHPHSWSILDSKNMVEWIVKLISN